MNEAMEKEKWEVEFDEAFPTIYLQYYGYKANDVIKNFIRELIASITLCDNFGCDKGKVLSPDKDSAVVPCEICDGKGWVVK